MWTRSNSTYHKGARKKSRKSKHPRRESSVASSNNRSGSSSSNNGNTVRFNVGGWIYEVSKSLLNQHPETMLARFASDTWSPGASLNHDDDDGDERNAKNAPLFIDRNGQRFQYVLDYMRDGGNVVLPLSISKEALLRDLEYYCFSDIDPSKISREAALPMLQICHDRIDDFIDSLKSQRCLKQQLLELAIYCLSEYRKKGSLEFTVRVYDANLSDAAEALEYSEQNQRLFDRILEPLGLRFRSCEKNYSVTLQLFFPP